MELPVNYNDIHFKARKIARNEYIRLQDGKCYYCKENLDGDPAKDVMKKWVNPKLFPKNFFKWPVHLHHDHETGMTIGAVHCHCNAVLWQYHNK